MEISDLIQTIGIIVAIGGLIFSIWSNRKQTIILNDQLKLNFFADYTKRYQEIILNLPENINAPNFDYNVLSSELRNRTLRYMRAYFDLSSEEYDLWRAGYIETRIWNNWKNGICFALSKKAFRDAWEIVKLDTVYYPEFNSLIEIIITENEKMPAANIV